LRVGHEVCIVNVGARSGRQARHEEADDDEREAKYAYLVGSASDGAVTSYAARAVVPGRRRPVEEYVRGPGRFRHLFEPVRQDEAIAHIQAGIDRYWQAVSADVAPRG
jgi:hypothetical protein